jgi:hypothetical protein
MRVTVQEMVERASGIGADGHQPQMEPDPTSVTTMTFEEGLCYDTSNDPNTLLGMVGGKTTRFLCKGKGGWLVGPSGVGKSVLLYQMGVLWTLGRPVFGIAPVKPLRILIFQAENDAGDIAEMVQGAALALGIDSFSPEFEVLNGNLKIVTECSSIGQQFCRRLGREIEQFEANLALVDPLLSFAGIDISRQDKCSEFLRGWMNPMLAATGAGLIGTHHTGKPKLVKDTRGMSALDYAYAGLGSSELVNWARAIMVINPHADVFEVMLTKRGKRAGAIHPNGEPTTSLWLRHASDKLWWEQIEAPAESPREQSAPGGRPSKVDELLALGLGLVIDSLTEPASKNEVARRIEELAASRKLDVGLRSCVKAVERLVSNGAVKKQGGLYVKA